MDFRRRSDLEYFHLEDSTGTKTQMQWVVRDPLNRQCFHLGEEEYFLLSSLNGNESFSEIQKQFELKFAPRTLTFSEYQNLVADWAIKGLLICDPFELQKLKAAVGLPVTSKRASQFWQRFSNPLVIRFRGWDPQRFLEMLSSTTGFIYSRGFLFASLVLFIFAISIAVNRFGQIVLEAAQLPLLFEPQHWLMIVLLIGFTKVLHEFGHALTCHRYGGRCHEMGIMFLAFMPCLYCNVTDAWTFPRRRQRVAVSAAGIIVDLWVAATCLIIWSMTQPGFLHSACLLLAIFGSVNSVLLNGNPLMRYDGYYMMSDLLGIPNMRTESQRQARQSFWSFLFGAKPGKIREHFSPSLATYGLASGVYLWFVILIILIGLHFVLKPFHLEVFALILGILIVPAQLRATGKQLQQEAKNEFHQRGRRKWRAMATGILLTSIILLGILIPIPRRIPAIGVIRPVSRQTIVATNPGHIMQASRPGEIIHAGATVLQLQNTHLDQQLLTLQNRIETLKVKIKAIQIKRTQYENSTETLLLLNQIRHSLQNEQEQLRRQKASLRLIAKDTGKLIPDPSLYKNRFLSKRQENLQQHLSGSSLLEEAYHAAFIPEGTRIGMITKPDSYEVLLAVEEHWARNVAVGTDVLIFSKESPENRLTGILRGISLTMHEARFVDKELLPDQQLLHRYLNQQPGRSKKKYFYAVVSIAEEQSDSAMSYYQLCRVRLRTANSSLWNRFSDFLSRTLVRL